MKAPRWLGRNVAAPGPFLSLVLSQKEFDAALRHCKQSAGTPWLKNSHCNATAHWLDNPAGELVCIVAISGCEGRDPIEVAGLLVHEAVHVWQSYCESIGEEHPGREQEAYAIQRISQELMSEFARRIDDTSR